MVINLKKHQILISICNSKLKYIAESSNYVTEHLSLAVQSEMLNLTRGLDVVTERRSVRPILQVNCRYAAAEKVGVL
jgi:hypothetical protein